MKSAAERISRLVRLPARERALLVRAWSQLLLVDVALRVVPVRWLLRPGRLRVRAAPSVPPERIAWLLDVARRYSPAPSTCLKDSLVLVRMLRTEGIDAHLRVGVARRDGALRAHAWVEAGGQIVFGAVEGETYAPLTAEPRHAR